jgi:hypothetical protein
MAGICIEAYAAHCRVVNGGSVRPLRCARSLLELGGWDATLATVAELLADPSLSGPAKAEFREIVGIPVPALGARRSGSQSERLI